MGMQQQVLLIGLLSLLCDAVFAQTATPSETEDPNGRYSTLADGYIILIVACYLCVVCVIPSLFFIWKSRKDARVEEERERRESSARKKIDWRRAGRAQKERHQL